MSRGSGQIDVLTLGETMVLLDPVESGPLEGVLTYRQRTAGAESNFAIASARLGLRSAWLSRLGSDPFGRLIRQALESEGVEVHADTEPDAPTAVFFKERLSAETVNVHYYRSGSAASRLRAEDVPKALVQRARLFHFTGVTMALDGTIREAALQAVELARNYRLEITFDPNLRPQLWTAERARRSLDPLLRDLDILLTGEAEIQLLMGQERLSSILAELRRRAIRIAVIKRGGAGAVVVSDDIMVEIPAAAVAGIVDSVGAGDAFNAGFVAGHLRGLDLAACGRLGGALGASAIRGSGDYETVPTWPEAEQLAASIPARSLERPA